MSVRSIVKLSSIVLETSLTLSCSLFSPYDARSRKFSIRIRQNNLVRGLFRLSLIAVDLACEAFHLSFKK